MEHRISFTVQDLEELVIILNHAVSNAGTSNSLPYQVAFSRTKFLRSKFRKRLDLENLSNGEKK